MRKLTQNQYSAIDRYKELGQIVSQELPQIADDYINNLTLREIVNKYNIIENYKIHNEEIARSAVSYALRFLLPEEELERLVKIHNYNNGKRTIKKGCISWNEEEKNLLLKITSQPRYNMTGKPNRKLIADELNKLIHKGKNVRNNKSISAMIFRIKKESQI